MSKTTKKRKSEMKIEMLTGLLTELWGVFGELIDDLDKCENMEEVDELISDTSKMRNLRFRLIDAGIKNVSK